MRSNVAVSEGLTEELVSEVLNYENSTKLSPRETAALRFADLFKAGEQAIDRDEVYAELKRQFCELNPVLRK